MTTTSKYLPQEVEQKWQKKWAEEGLYKPNLNGEKKFYVLAEFAYPSGDLHIGHWFMFCGADIFARFKRMQGYNVFFPNGFDAFGLPAENAAIKRGVHPQEWTMSNIEKMKAQFNSMGASFSFDNQVITCLPEFYRWNQWIFLRMLEKGIAYKGKYLSNWCPSCQTVLANEGVVDGACWRCGNQVVQKEVEQWFFKITSYADRLIWPASPASGAASPELQRDEPDKPSVDWPQSVRVGQNSWIGKSEGLEIKFKVDNSDQEIVVYTVFPETIFGVTYMVLAPEHPLVEELTTDEYKKEVSEYIKRAKKKSELERKSLEKEKSGIFIGGYCINPVDGKKVPVWIADYVIASYGTGAVMGVPGSDHRDFEFAKKYGIEVIRVIGKSESDNSPIKTDKDVLEEGILVNSGEFSGLKTPDPAREKMKKWMEQKGYGIRSVQYHLHDWSISRQRYWGTPLPIIYCPACGMMPVPDKDLPVELPFDVDYTPKGKSPLASNEEWMRVKCPKCGKDAQRDPDTMDTFVDSSWYFFRYLSPKYEKGPFDPKLAKKIMPVDIYFGGAEHTLGHTLYSRFFTKFFKDLGLTDLEEYAQRRVQHGVVLGPDGYRMSKSRGNIVNPDEEVKKYGADAVRVYVAFFMPYDGTGPWITERIWGPYRFLERIWGLVDKVSEIDPSEEDKVILNKTIKKVGDDIESISFNTAVAALMEWLNYLTKKGKISKLEYQTLIILVSPIAPHLSEEIWHILGNPGSIHDQSWPEVDSNHLQSALVSVIIQVDGRVRDNIQLSRDSIDNRKEVEKIALESQRVKNFIDGKSVKKIVYIPGKVINLVLN